MPLLWRPARPDSRRPRDVAALRELPQSRPDPAHGALLPLHVFACERCYLVQLEAFVPPDEIFTEYAYFSAYSTAFVEHARQYVEMISKRLGLGPDDLVVELASNDGYLLQHFVGTGIPILGIDPAANVAEAAEARGVPTLVDFFGRATAERSGLRGHAGQSDRRQQCARAGPRPERLHGRREGASPRGRDGDVRVPPPAPLFDRLLYDTIYHEHFSYFSFATIAEILRAHGLAAYDVEEVWTHGGSLRVYAQHDGGPHETAAAVDDMLAREAAEGLRSPARYAKFAEDVKESKRALLDLLIRLRREGKQVVGYGAPGKGNTLLNYCGIRTDLLDYTVDRNPYKHGLYTPGTHIPIFPPEKIAETRPDYILVLPWNLIDEIAEQLAYVAEWGGRLIMPLPYATVREVGTAQ